MKLDEIKICDIIVSNKNIAQERTDKVKYRENAGTTYTYREEYVSGIEQLIKKRQLASQKTRSEYIKGIFSNPEQYRTNFKSMLGWPLTEQKSESLPEITSEKLSTENGYSVYRMTFEILDGLKMCGLFFKSDSEEQQPLVVVSHGKLGTPELISGAYGDTYNYNDILERVIKHNVHAFAPQLLLWEEKYGVEYDRIAIDAQLKRVGSSVTAIEIYGITRILDYFEKQRYVNGFGMVGLSYGGFYTLYTAAVDTRIKSAVSCSYFNSRDNYPWPDWTWLNSAEKFDDAETACLVYPRHLCIELGTEDECFDYKQGEKAFEELQEISKEVGTDWVDFIAFDGKHEFCKNDAPIERLINDIKNNTME